MAEPPSEGPSVFSRRPNLFDSKPELLPFASPSEAELVYQLSGNDKEIFAATLRRRLDAWRAYLPLPRGNRCSEPHTLRTECGFCPVLTMPNFGRRFNLNGEEKQKPQFPTLHSDETWTPKAREWLEEERRVGRIFKNSEDAHAAFIMIVYMRGQQNQATPKVEADSNPLFVSHFGIVDPIVGDPASAAIYLQNVSGNSLHVHEAYAVAVGPFVPLDDANAAARIKNENAVFDKVVRFLDEAEKNKTAITLEVPPGQLHIFIHGNSLLADPVSSLQKAQSSIYFAGIMRYEVAGKKHQITYCGVSDTHIRSIVNCLEHNERN